MSYDEIVCLEVMETVPSAKR